MLVELVRKARNLRGHRVLHAGNDTVEVSQRLIRQRSIVEVMGHSVREAVRVTCRDVQLIEPSTRGLDLGERALQCGRLLRQQEGRMTEYGALTAGVETPSAPSRRSAGQGSRHARESRGPGSTARRHDRAGPA